MKLCLNKLFKTPFAFFLLNFINYFFYKEIFCQHDWIDYNKKYYPIPVYKTGIYRINRTALEQAGFPIDNISPKNIQIYAYGKEIPIYIEGEEDNIFNYEDYIEFFGKANDGWLDSLLYPTSIEIVNPYYSLFNDTIYYFLTWNNSMNNLRVKIDSFQNYFNYPEISKIYKEVINSYPNYYYYGEEGSWYGKGEGWASYYTELGGCLDVYVNSSDPYPNEPFTFEFKCIGVSNSPYTGPGNHHLKVFLNNIEIFDTIFTGTSSVKKNLILSQNLSHTTHIKFCSYDDLNLLTDKIAFSYLKIYYVSYPTINNTNFFEFDETPTPYSYLKLSYPYNQNLILWDYINGIKILTSYENGYYHALIKNIGEKRKIFLYPQDSIIYAKVLTGKIFKNYLQNTNYNYIIITHNSLLESVQQFASFYVQNGYNVLICNVDELYDQYAYGIPKHPLGIKNFLKLYDKLTPNKEKFVLLFGKGIRNEYSRKNSNYYNQNLIPTYGTPPSDFLYLIADSILNFSIGRLSISTNEEAINYLNKLRDYQNSSCQEWNKRVVHFSGGMTYNEQTTISLYINALKNIIEDTLYGANVFTFYKTTSEPIQTSIADSAKNIINNGCSIITFFGHATPTGFDHNIDNPQYYNNYKKYPLIFANTCFSGDIFLPLPPKRISEEWVTIPNKGAIAFFASSDIGYTDYLYIFAEEFYKQLSYKNFNKPIGTIIRNTIKNLTNNNFYTKLAATCYDYIYHGDPTIILPVNNNPDLFVKNSDISFFPKIIETDIDSFELKFIITNAGRAFNKNYTIKLKRFFPDGTSSEIYLSRLKCLYKDTVIIKLPTELLKSAGINKFCIYVDFFNNILECNELNNETCLLTNISISDITPVFPYEFSIYPYDTLTLKASTGNPFAPLQQYLFEIDTTDLFNSPFKKSYEITSIGGVVKCKLDFTLIDSTVYFWRVSPKHTLRWKESSFMHIKNKIGWAQAHFFQFKKNSFKFFNYNRNERKLKYINTPKILRCKTFGTNAASSYFDYWFQLEGYIGKSSCGPAGAILVVVIDPVYIIPWSSDIEDYGHANFPVCLNKTVPDYYFTFYTYHPSHLLNLNEMLQNVPDSHYILIYNFISGNFQNWPEELYQTFESLGANLIRNVPNDGAYIFFTKKGNLQSTIELYGNTYDTLYFEYEIKTNYHEGYMTSTLIGPSFEWNSLFWSPTNIEQNDTIELKVYGFNFTNDSTFLFSLKPPNFFIPNLNSLVSYTQYPFLKLIYYTKDKTNKTSPQLIKWIITYEQAPETAINPQLGYVFKKDTLYQGENLIFSVATENISLFDMDSLLVKYWIINSNNEIAFTKIKRLRKHPTKDILMDTLIYNTINLFGTNTLWYEVNTINPQTNTFDQLEQYHFNNYATKSFYVQKDIANPILDITFDGRRILNGEIVSAKPLIKIVLKDENKFLPLNDTSIFSIFIIEKNTNKSIKVNFNNIPYPIEFIPATLPENKCVVNIKPTLSDGKYILKVNARDISGNYSGSNYYEVEFEVINKPSITNVINYPNPFSTSTQFIFTLTGSEIPDDLRIQIFNINGKLVKEIKKEELGNIRIGLNITDYKWDGTDMYGNKLANGVYFYKVIAKLNNKDLEIRTSNYDKFFKHGFGKLYILR